METVLILLSAGITIFALNLLIVSLLSYWKFRNNKLLLMSGVFLLFFIKGIILSYSVLQGLVVDLSLLISVCVFDFIILVALYITSLKR